MAASTTSYTLPTQSAHSGNCRRLKVNVVVLDGANLHNSKVLELQPIPAGRPAVSADDDSTWGERHSWMLREVLDFVCRSDSRFYGRRYDVSTEDYREQLRLYQNPSDLVKRRHMTYVIEQTVWFVVKEQYRFQVDNMYNQMEDVCVHILNICMREVRKEAYVIGPHILYLAVREYHNRLFANYFKWCDYLGENPFPWEHPPWLENSYCSADEESSLTSVTVHETEEYKSGCSDIFPPATRRDMQKMTYEIALFKLLWGEAFNLRHTPEFLCWIFHWLCLAWKPTFVAEENFVDFIRDVLQRARDEQWYLASALRSPDHCSRLLYDDINEVFWEREAVRLLKKAKENGDRLHSLQQGSGQDDAQSHSAAIAGSDENANTAAPAKCRTEECLRLEPTRENMNLFIDRLLYASEPGKGIKTFLERRTYLQVLRSFWRVLAWQCISFAFLFYLRALIDDEPIDMLSICWNRTLFTTVSVHAVEPLFDLLLANWRALRKKHFWRFFLRDNLLNALRLGFFSVAVAIVFLEGLQSPLLSWKGTMGAAYSVFYLLHGLHYFLYVRISGAMPFFHFLWRLPLISSIAKPSTFTGNTALLAEDLTHVIKYVLFWIPIIALKLAYWIFLVVPELLEAAKHIEAAAARPFLVGSMAMFFEENPVVLRLVLWTPALLLWVFDLQIFFILGGTAYGSLEGCWRRVSFFKSTRKIQKRLLPVLSSVPIFKPSSSSGSDNEMADKKQCIDFAFSDFNRGRHLNTFIVERAFSRAESSHMENRTSLHVSTTNQKTAPKIQYHNRSDPYRNMVPLLRTRSLANRLLPGQCVDDTAMARKRFGFLWNEVVYSWRQEDIISNAELGLLLFNELPLLDIPNDDWSVTRLDKKHSFIRWEKSTFRLPVYCYCDVVLGFLKKCELFHHQVKDEIARFNSKKAAAAHFFREHVSDDPRHQDPRFKDSLHIEAGAEIAEALFLYLSRYFEKGVGLVDTVVDLWNWIKEDGSRLLWISMISLKELAIVLEQLFTVLQSSGTWGEKEHARLERVNVILEQRLTTLIELPTDDPMAAENDTLPEVIKEYLSSIKTCFRSMRTGSFPSLYPHPVDVEEVNAMIRYLQVVMSHTRQLHIVEYGDIEEGRNLLPMTTEQMAEARCLHYILSKAEADVVVSGALLGQGEFVGNAEAKKRLGQAEHAVKLYFRRAARILRASNPFLVTPEADRRLKQFANSLLMKMPGSPEVHKMISMVTLTPYYREDTVLDVQDLERPTEEGVSKMELLRSLHPQELEHFLERVDREKDMFTIHQELENRVADSPFERKQAIKEVRRLMQQSGLLERYDRFSEALQEWASYRGQVLMRTVRGMMYHEHAIKMQAYLEQMSYANLHLCHDLNRLDFEQLKVLNSPESGLWEEVVTVPPAYELCPVVTAMARLKYQYIVAAQEFGADILIQPSRERAMTGEARSRLLRKLWMHKILFRYPNLRVATVEAERDNRGVPTGYKVGKLYRLSTTPDSLRQYVRPPQPYVPRAPTHASTYQREVNFGPADAAEMPKPQAQHLHMQFDPEDGSNFSENFTINTRSGGTSSGTASEKDAEESSTSVKKQQPANSGMAAENGTHVDDVNFTSDSKEGKNAEAGFSFEAQIDSERGCIPKQQRTRPRSARDRDIVGHDAARSDDSSDDNSKRARCSGRKYKHAPMFATTNCNGNFHADVASLVQKTHKHRAKDQRAAANMHRLVRKITERDFPFSSEIRSDHTLHLAASRESEAFDADRPLVATRNAVAHSAVPGSSSLTSWSSLLRDLPVSSFKSNAAADINNLDGWLDDNKMSYSESLGLSPTLCPYYDDTASSVDCSSEDDITEFSGYAENAPLTLLAYQHTRELARDRNSVVIWKLTASEVRATGTCRLLQCSPAPRIQHEGASGRAYTCHNRGARTSSQRVSSSMEACGPRVSVIQPFTDKQRRRHSIITLHPVKQTSPHAAGGILSVARNDTDVGAIRNAQPFLRYRKMLRQGQPERSGRRHPTEEHIIDDVDDHLLRPRHTRRFHIDGIHAIEPVRSCSQLRREKSRASKEAELGRHSSSGSDSREQAMNTMTNARARRCSVDETCRPGSPFAFARRVAMFEEYFKRNKNNEVYARLYKRTAQRGRRAMRRYKPLIWLSSRGPMGLQAVYTLRLPLIVDEDRQPWDKYPFIGPGKPENQNHAMAFTRMETLQVVDMNMEGYLEEALKLRNLLQEFVAHPRMRILGFREHIFTENVSSLASFMALQENVFTTTNQRLYHEPLQVRMHYGHPDIFDRFFIQTCGSCSKSSKQLHLSEDVFAGFNCTARGYSVRHVDYIQCGKGRDVGLHQVVMFERKVAGGNAEQMLSRDVCRMAKNMDFFRLLSLYFSGPGFFFGAVILFLAAYVSLYVKCLFSFSQYKYKGVTESALRYVVAPTTYVQFQLGFLLLLPLVIWLLAEKGLWIAFARMVDLMLKFAVAYYNFMIGTKAMIIDHVLLYGGARYQETGRGFVVTHMSLRELWQLYYFTHFSVGIEMTFLLVVYARFCGFNAGVYFLDTWPLYLMSFSLLYVPFLYNPLGMYYPRLLEDITAWRQWMASRDQRNEHASWFAWWRAEMEGRCNIAWHHQLILTVRLMRFLLISVGMVSCVAMTIRTSDIDCVVYLFGTAGCSLFLIIFLDDLKLASPNWNTALSVMMCLAGAFATGWLLVTGRITLSVLLTSSTAFLIFSYGLLEISFVLLGRWAVRNDVLAEAARTFHYLGGFIVFCVPLLLAGFTLSFHKIQTRILFNPRFVTIVKSGLVQRAEVTKKGHTKK